MYELIIDIGSKTIRIAKPNADVVIAEPAVAVIKYEPHKMSLVACGNAVKQHLGSLETGEQVMYPIKEGCIAHSRAAILMFSSLIANALPVQVFLKPRVKITALISAGLNSAEKREIEEVLLASGARSVTMLESLIAAHVALEKENVCVVDIGGTKSEIGILGDKRIVCGVSVGIGGDQLNFAISDYVADKYRVSLEKNTTEKLKKSLASMFYGDAQTATVGGKGISDNLPKSLELKAAELREAMIPVLDKLIDAVNSVLNQTPDKIAEDVYKNGIVLIGGTAELSGLAEYMSEKILMDVRVPKSPENVSVNGGVMLSKSKTDLAKALNLSVLTTE